MRRLFAIAALLVMLFGMSGCSMFSGTYVYQRPHQGGNHGGQSIQQIASSYPEILTSLALLISQGEPSGVIVLTDLSEQVAKSYLQAAVKNIYVQDPVASYAVEHISFELGSNAGRMAAAVHISYSRSRSDISGINTVKNMREAELLIGQTLEQAAGSIVFRVEEYEQTDFTALVQRYADMHAAMVMEVPQVMSALYPHSGENRLVELTFTYQNSQADLLEKQALVRPVVLAAELYVQGGSTPRKKYQQLHSFLMERTDYTLKPSVTPAYSLLQDGIGDSSAFACVYAALCNQAGLDCRVIHGTKDGKEWSWNRVVISNRVYYIDVIEAEKIGRVQFLTASEMTGYIWER